MNRRVERLVQKELDKVHTLERWFSVGTLAKWELKGNPMVLKINRFNQSVESMKRDGLWYSHMKLSSTDFGSEEQFAKIALMCAQTDHQKEIMNWFYTEIRRMASERALTGQVV